LRRRIVLRSLTVLALLAIAFSIDAFWLEPASLRVQNYSIVLDGAPPSMRGLRIVIVSDLHGGSRFIDEDKIAHVVSLANAAKPDLVLLTGDYLATSLHGGAGRVPIAAVARAFKALHAPLGTYAVLGNHDIWFDADRVISAFKAAGIPVLENTARVIPTPRGPLYLVGIGDAYTRHADPARAVAQLPAGARAICFTHSPDIFPGLSPACRLTIAGHTHGGQVYLPLLGRLVVPSRYGQRYAAGLIHGNGHDLFVSTGIGTSIYPVRFLVPPEVSVLDLR